MGAESRTNRAVHASALTEHGGEGVDDCGRTVAHACLVIPEEVDEGPPETDSTTWCCWRTKKQANVLQVNGRLNDVGET